MIFVDPDGDFDHGTLTAEMQRLERLLGLLRALLERGIPDPPELEAAPYLNGWRAAGSITPVLTGSVSGHPLLPGAGRLVATSEVRVFAPAMSAALTGSRWYRLGAPAEGLEATTLN